MGNATCSKMCSNPSSSGSHDSRIIPTYEIHNSTHTFILPTNDEKGTVFGEQAHKSMAHLKFKAKPIYAQKDHPLEQGQIQRKAPSDSSTGIGLSETELNLKNNESHGANISKSESKYTGGWKDGEKHGYGEEEWPDGSKFVGNYSMNQKNGVGIHTYADGSTYEGNWSGGLKHGKGKQINKDGSMYDGQWRLGKKDGYGIFRSPDGECYSGEFKDDLPNGNGTYSRPSGEKVRGFWLQGNFEQSPSEARVNINIANKFH